MKGSTVTVVRGRKVPIGTTGVVIWVGEGRSYGPRPRYRGGWYEAPPPARIGVKDAAGTVHWTAASNVEVTEAAPAAAPWEPAAGFSKGTKVETLEGPGKVFWVGPDKRNAGGTRLGIKLNANGETLWASTTEVALTNAPPRIERPAPMLPAPENYEAAEREAIEAEAVAEHLPDPPPLAAPITGAMAWATGKAA